jgi:Ras GTPase-activating-like protein IQGAP2/3
MQHGVIPESPGYQSIINMIAVDITKKGERRKLRNAEIKKLQTILYHLEEKRNFLTSQGDSYKEYLDSCMKNMAEKRGKKQKFVFPFTRQYFHIKNLQKRGLVPKFGSFKYSAKTLYDRGIILDLAGVSNKMYSRITIILSMDRAGIVTFEGYFPLLNTQDLHVDVHYEDLLQTQYEGVQTMKVLDGMATVNVNLLIYLINKK